MDEASTLLIQFAVRFDMLRSGDLDPWPQFSEWLPDGQKDALLIFGSSESVKLSVWFERRGRMQDGLIEFDLGRHEVDDEVLKTQTPVHAGPLFGLLWWGRATQHIEDTLRAGKASEDYETLGKTILQFLQPKLADFIEVIRTVYGQYWVPSLPPWDSRTRSLGAYCSGVLSMKWSLDNGETWQNFVPDKPRVSMTLEAISLKSEHKYLREEDWPELAVIARQAPVFSSAAQILGRALMLLDEGRLENAIIDSVTALEMSVGEALRAHLAGSQDLLKCAAPLTNISLKARVLAVAGGLGIDRKDLEEVMNGVDLRNAIVHEGKHFESHGRARKSLKALAAVISKLAQPNIRKTPRANVGYSQRFEED